MRFTSRPLSVLISACLTHRFASCHHSATAAAAASSAAAAAFIPNSLLRKQQQHLYTTTHPKGGVSLSRMSSSSSLSSSSNAKEDSSSTNTRVALCQFHVTSDKATNHATAKNYIERAAQAGAKLVVLPEIWNSPYATAAFPDYAEPCPNVGDTLDDDDDDASTSSALASSSRLLMELAKTHQLYLVGGSIPELVIGNVDNNNNNNEAAATATTKTKKMYYNTCLVIDPSGKVVAKHRKVHLFDIDVPGGITFRESDTLSPGQDMTVFDAGDAFGTVGVGICYDIRFPEYAMLLAQQMNCKILIYPGAFNMTTGPAHWELLQRARANDNQCFVMMCSPARSLPPDDNNNNNDDKEEEHDNHDSSSSSSSSSNNENKKYPHYTAWGYSTVVNPWGTVVAKADETESLLVTDLEMSKVDEVRQGIPISFQKRHDMYQLSSSS